MTLTYVAKVGLITQKTSVSTQKIDGLPLEIHDMASAKFLIQDGLEMIRFFERIFMLVDTNIELILRMPFLSFCNVDVQFRVEKVI